jgi:hypothetical protein
MLPACVQAFLPFIVFFRPQFLFCFIVFLYANWLLFPAQSGFCRAHGRGDG